MVDGWESNPNHPLITQRMLHHIKYQLAAKGEGDNIKQGTNVYIQVINNVKQLFPMHSRYHH